MMFTINFKQCNPNRYTIGRMDVKWIVVHYTAGEGNAEENAIYFSRTDDTESSAHYFIDSESIWQSVPDADTAWHAGNAYVNANSIGIEVCSAGEDFTQGEIERLAWLVQKLMGEYGVSASNVIRHYDVVDVAPAYTATQDPHKLCPAPYINDVKWRDLWLRITSGIQEIEDDMHCLIKPDGMGYMVYYDGVNLHALKHPDEMKAVQEVYKLCNDGREIPCFEFGSPDAPWSARFFDAVNAKAPDYGYWEAVTDCEGC